MFLPFVVTVLLPPVEVTDLYRFGIVSREQTAREWMFMSEHCRRMRNRQRCRLDPHIDLALWIAEADYVCKVWDTLDNAALWTEYGRKIEALAKVRSMIGSRAYYAGHMPSTAPFRRLEHEVWHLPVQTPQPAAPWRLSLGEPTEPPPVWE